MSSLNVDTIKNRTGTAGPTIAGDTQISGGGLTLSGTLIAQSGIVTNLTVNGRLSVAGTMTTIDTEQLNIKDKLVGIGSTATPTNALADGAGIQIFGTTDKTLTYNITFTDDLIKKSDNPIKDFLREKNICEQSKQL